MSWSDPTRPPQRDGQDQPHRPAHHPRYHSDLAYARARDVGPTQRRTRPGARRVEARTSPWTFGVRALGSWPIRARPISCGYTSSGCFRLGARRKLAIW